MIPAYAGETGTSSILESSFGFLHGGMAAHNETFMLVWHNQSHGSAVMKTGFGWIEIGGTRYEHDVVIHSDGRVSKRKKKPSKKYRDRYGHTPLSEEELVFLEDEQPDIFYAGLGQDGALPVTPRAEALIARYHGVLKPTPEILPLLESEKRKFVAILHVTC